MKLILLTKFNTLHEATIARSFLNSKGIEATIFDKHTVNIYATPGIFGGVRLMVPSHQLTQAREELNKQKEFAVNNQAELIGEPCPKCASTSTELSHVHRKDLFFLVLSIIFLFPMNKESSRDWTCHSCANTWSVKSSSFENHIVVYVIRFFILILVAYTLYLYFKKAG